MAKVVIGRGIKGEKMELTKKEIVLILQSLSYTRKAFETYTMYPSDDYKKERMQEVDDLMAKLRKG